MYGGLTTQGSYGPPITIQGYWRGRHRHGKAVPLIIIDFVVNITMSAEYALGLVTVADIATEVLTMSTNAMNITEALELVNLIALSAGHTVTVATVVDFEVELERYVGD